MSLCKSSLSKCSAQFLCARFSAHAVFFLQNYPCKTFHATKPARKSKNQHTTIPRPCLFSPSCVNAKRLCASFATQASPREPFSATFHALRPICASLCILRRPFFANALFLNTLPGASSSAQVSPRYAIFGLELQAWVLRLYYKLIVSSCHACQSKSRSTRNSGFGASTPPTSAEGRTRMLNILQSTLFLAHRLRCCPQVTRGPQKVQSTRGLPMSAPGCVGMLNSCKTHEFLHMDHADLRKKGRVRTAGS